MRSQEGKKVPDAVFHARKQGESFDVTSQQLFSNRTVVLFALPGAFTPTCSSTHLPRYDELTPVLKHHGVDEVVCVSVNDGFVMDAWAQNQGIRNVTLLPDGNGEFTEKLGFLVDKAAAGFGKRSWRYSMLVKNGVIEKMFIEPDKPGDPFEVSDADTMLRHISKDAKLPPEVAIFTKPGCQFCKSAKALLKEKGYAFEEISLSSGISYKTLRAVTGKQTAPQIYINGTHIDGFSGLQAYFKGPH